MKVSGFAWAVLLLGFVGAGADPQEGRRWAVLVGVGQYEDTSINALPYAPGDARAFRALLLERGGFGEDHIALLVDGAEEEFLPTRSNILGKLSVWLKLKARAGDAVIFYFSGHGIGDQETGYLVPADAHLYALTDESVSLKRVRDYLKKSGAEVVFLVLDACHSGLAEVGGAEGGMSEGFGKTLLLLEEEGPASAKGWVALTSCGAGEYSYPLDTTRPFSPDNRSAFTNYFLEGLAGPADASPQDGVITIRELNEYVHHRVTQWALSVGVSQEPQLNISGSGAVTELRLVWTAATGPDGEVDRAGPTLGLLEPRTSRRAQAAVRLARAKAALEKTEASLSGKAKPLRVPDPVTGVLLPGPGFDLQMARLRYDTARVDYADADVRNANVPVGRGDVIEVGNEVSSLKLIGIASDDKAITEVAINGVAAELSPAAWGLIRSVRFNGSGVRFEGQIALAPGDNTVGVVATDTFGNRASLSFTVRRKEAPESRTPSLALSTWRRSKIAFVSDRDFDSEIYVMDSDGTDQRNLTSSPGVDTGPSWCPDGSKIAFVSNRDGNEEIYVMNSDGTGQSRLTNNPARDYGPCWSPDGGKIIFTSDRDDGRGDVYAMDRNGENTLRLTSNPAYDGCGAWSPDGKKIAFESDRDGIFEIYLMDSDGGNQRRLAFRSEVALNYHPAWSPDGKKIAFQSERDGKLEIYAMSSDGEPPAERLTNNEVDESRPCWSPDGKNIAFDSNRDGNHEIYVMNSDGTNVTRLTRNAAEDWYPSWSPF